MKRLLVIVGLLFFAGELYAVDCSRHKIYCKIVSISPKINKVHAMRISNLIYRHAKQHKTDPMISVAIAAQENAFNNTTVEETVVRKLTTCDVNVCTTKTTTKHLKDIGLFQINEHTARRNGMDEDLLMRDIAYNVNAHFVILKKKIRACKHLGREAWSCYHSATPKYRKRYVRHVSKFLKGGTRGKTIRPKAAPKAKTSVVERQKSAESIPSSGF